MSNRMAVASPVLLAALVTGAAVAFAPKAAASGDDWGLNGTYTVTSNGDWARTNDVYRDEISVRSTWTITTSCTTPVECTGQVVSDQGWSAPVAIHGSEYIVKRDIPNWEPCPDGTARIGHQIYRFWPVDERGWFTLGSPVLGGQDATSGETGACGINKALIISSPLRLEKAG